MTLLLLGTALQGFAGVTLLVNGGSIATVNAGDPITFTWTATPDIAILTRGWGDNAGTTLPAYSGSETIRALTPTVSTGYSYTVTGYAAGSTVQASVQVNVQPLGFDPGYTPIVWVPSVPNFQLQTLSFMVLPDAVIGTPYSTTINATGKAPITYSAVGLPDGLTVTGNTISGTPTEAALLQGGNFTLMATDADGITSATLARMMTPVLAPRNLTPVTAPVVFDGGIADLNSAYVNEPSAGLGRAASGFMLAKATTVTSVRVWGTYFGASPSSDDFTITFIASGPSPIASTWPSFPAAGKVLATFKPTSMTRLNTGRATYGIPSSEWTHDLNFTGIALEANTLYYVCVVNNSDSRSWGWLSSTIQNFPSWGAYSNDGGITFPGGSFELAFTLSDAPAVVTVPPTKPPVTTYKLDIKRNGKGTVVFTPTGTSSSGTVFNAGTIVTVMATPDASDKNSVWKGWTGDVVSSSRTITVTMSKAVTLQANFR